MGSNPTLSAIFELGIVRFPHVLTVRTQPAHRPSVANVLHAPWSVATHRDDYATDDAGDPNDPRLGPFVLSNLEKARLTPLRARTADAADALAADMYRMSVYS